MLGPILSQSQDQTEPADNTSSLNSNVLIPPISVIVTCYSSIRVYTQVITQSRDTPVHGRDRLSASLRALSV